MPEQLMKYAVAKTVSVRFAERRREPRTRLDAIPAHIRLDDNPEPIPAQVLDISTSGIRVGLDFSLTVGKEVTVWFDNVIATGQVRYCRHDLNDHFYAGVQIKDVVHTVSESLHDRRRAFLPGH